MNWWTLGLASKTVREAGREVWAEDVASTITARRGGMQAEAEGKVLGGELIVGSLPWAKWAHGGGVCSRWRGCWVGYALAACGAAALTRRRLPSRGHGKGARRVGEGERAGRAATLLNETAVLQQNVLIGEESAKRD